MSTATGQSGVLVGVDGSPASNRAVVWAAHDAAMRRVGLTIVHAVTPVDATLPIAVLLPTGISRWQLERGQRVVDEAVAIAQRADRSVRLESTLLPSPAVPALIELSENAQLVVVGSRGTGPLARSLLGSVSSNLIRHAHCPVAVIPDHDPEMTNPGQAPVLVGIDGSPTSELATAIAYDEASRRGVELVALHVFSDVEVNDFPPIDWPAVKPQAEETLAERLAGWQDDYPDVKVRRVVECDHPIYQLITHAESAQLTVVGSHGRGGFTGMLLGSVSSALAHTAHTPVIVARCP